MTHVNSIVLALLVLATLCAAQTSAASHACCREFTRGRIPFRLIKGYLVQSVQELCPIDAIIFIIKKGKKEKKACANPALDWVKDYVGRFSIRAQTFHQKS